METTGMVRRIDELGRIVIPKEIRKSLRIKDGDNLEILISDSDKILLRKFSMMKNISDLAQDFTDSIYAFLKKNIMIADTNQVLAASGEYKKEILNKEISSEINQLIKNREELLEKYSRKLNLVTDFSVECTYTINPIIVSGDAIGAVIIFSTEDKITDSEEKIVKIASRILSKYLEE